MEWLNWGRGIKWSPYLTLMEHPNIYDVNDGEPKYCWKFFKNLYLDKPYNI